MIFKWQSLKFPRQCNRLACRAPRHAGRTLPWRPPSWQCRPTTAGQPPSLLLHRPTAASWQPSLQQTASWTWSVPSKSAVAEEVGEGLLALGAPGLLLVQRPVQDALGCRAGSRAGSSGGSGRRLGEVCVDWPPWLPRRLCAGLARLGGWGWAASRAGLVPPKRCPAKLPPRQLTQGGGAAPAAAAAAVARWRSGLPRCCCRRIQPPPHFPPPPYPAFHQLGPTSAVR